MRCVLDTNLLVSGIIAAGAAKPLQAVTNRGFTGIPSLAVAPGGRLWDFGFIHREWALPSLLR